MLITLCCCRQSSNVLNDLTEARATAEQPSMARQNELNTISDILLPFPDFRAVFMEYYDIPVVAQAKREA